MTDERVLRLQAPHPGQIRIRRQLKRFNHLRMGRRWGKSHFGIDYLISDAGDRLGALHGYPTGWFAPTTKLLTDAWRDAKWHLRPVTVHKDERDHRLALSTGGSLEFWTLEVDDPARGRKYAKVFVDEAAMARGLLDKWNQAIRPTLTDFAGGACFGSTPKGRNDFFRLEQQLRERMPESLACFQAPSSENPYLPAGEIEAARRELPELVFRQEYLGEYVDFSGALVRPEHLQTGSPTDALDIVLGVDLAISTKTTADYTAIVAMSRHPVYGSIYVRGALRFRGSFNEILKQIAMAATRWNAALIVVEDVQFQAAVVQELLRTTTLPVIGYKPGDKDKLTRFLPVVARYEQKLIWHAATLPTEFVDELLSFTGTEDDDHDDFVDAETMAYHGLGMMGVQIASAGKRDSQESQLASYMEGLQ